MIDCFFFVFGLAIGSFINCLVYRLNHGLSPFYGRSFCPECKHQLVWFDNIPLLSFILLGGRCRYCQKKIGLHYPLVELGAGILTLSIFTFQFSLYNLLIIYALIAIFLSDFLYMTIPDAIVYPAIGLTFLFRFRVGMMVDVLVAGLGAAAFFLGLVFLTKGRGMGRGDVKLAGLMGFILGYPKIIVALYFAFLTGALVGVILILLNKKSLNTQIPFGPFLVLGTLVSMFWGEIIWAKSLALLLLKF